MDDESLHHHIDDSISGLNIGYLQGPILIFLILARGLEEGVSHFHATACSFFDPDESIAPYITQPLQTWLNFWADQRQCREELHCDKRAAEVAAASLALSENI